MVITLDTADLGTSIGYLLRRANRRVREQTIPRLDENGLSPMELTSLYLVFHNRNCTLRDLAAAAFIEPPTMHRIVKSLEKKGLITRNKAGKDARFVFIRITDKGISTSNEAIEAVLDTETAILKKLSSDEQKVLFSALNALTQVENE